MKPIISIIAAGAIASAPTTAFAAPGGNQPTPGSISPAHDTGQQVPPVECGEDGPAPGQSADAPGGGSAFADEDVSVSGAHYAGTQPQNSKNTASVSQYDIACAHQPQ
jgi:hypothetical protein